MGAVRLVCHWRTAAQPPTAAWPFVLPCCCMLRHLLLIRIPPCDSVSYCTAILLLAYTCTFVRYTNRAQTLAN